MKVSEDQIATAGRDGAVRLWQIGDDKNCVETLCIKEHEGFVNAVAFIPSTSDYSEGKILLISFSKSVYRADCKRRSG